MFGGVVQAQQGLLTIGDDLQQAGVEIPGGPVGDGGGLAEPDPEGHITLRNPIHRRPEHDGGLAAAAVAGEDGGSAIGKDLRQLLVDVLVDHIAAAGDDPQHQLEVGVHEVEFLSVYRGEFLLGLGHGCAVNEAGDAGHMLQMVVRLGAGCQQCIHFALQFVQSAGKLNIKNLIIQTIFL